jgi:hypothetical protein
MGRKWILGAIALAAAGTTAVAATSVLGEESAAPERPDYATVDVRLDAAPSRAARPSARARGHRKPRVIYLQGQPATVDVAQTGPNIDIRLLRCPDRSRVIDGGVFPSDPSVVQQGSYIPSRREYHVLIGFPEGAAVQSFTLSSHLVCLKGVD